MKKLLGQAYKQIGIEIEFIEFPPPRVTSMMSRGKVDGILYSHPEIAKAITSIESVPVILSYEDISVFSKRDNFTVDGMKSLNKYTVGVIGGMVKAMGGIPDLKIDEVTNPNQLFLKLNADRDDVVILPRLSGLLLLKRLNIVGVKILSLPF